MTLFDKLWKREYIFERFRDQHHFTSFYEKKKQQQQQQKKSKWIITIKEEFNSFEQQKQNWARSVAAYSQHVVFEVVWNEVFIIAILVVSKDLSLSLNIYTAY